MDTLKNLAKAEVQRAMQMGRKLFKIPMPTPKIIWETRRWTGKAGCYRPRKNTIHLYEYYLQQFGEKYIMDTAAHEAAHAVMHFAHRDRPVKTHGPEFKGFMRHIDRDDSIYHSFWPAVQADKAARQKQPLNPMTAVFESWPVKIRTSSKAIHELSMCEEGSYEDWSADGKPKRQYSGSTIHIFEILQRHKSVIELRNYGEMLELKWAVDTGTFSMWMPKVCERLQDFCYYSKWPVQKTEVTNE